MRKILLILAMPIVLLMVGCAEEDAARDPQVTGSAKVKGMAIAFGAEDPGDTTKVSPYLTRAAVNTLNLSGVQTSGFGVFAAHTGLHTYANSSISSNFMYNQKVTYSSSNWTYSPIKYWPNGEDGSDLPDYISFFAYAPYSETASACITDFPLPIEMGDPWLIYRLADDVASQVDLLYATPVLDKTKPASTATDAEKKVSFKFKHALACVGDKVTTSISEELGNLLKTEVADKASLSKIEVILRKVSIVYTLTQKGKLSLASSTALWKPVMSGEFTTKRTVTVFDGSASPFTLATITDAVTANEHSVSDKGVFYIPLQVGNEPQQATCTIDYTIRRTISGTPTPTDFNGSTTKTVNLREAGGEIAGAHLNLEFQLSDQISVKGKSLASFYMQAANKVYTGSAITTEVTISDGNTVLREGTDYTLSYENNINAGIATVTATGMGNYDAESSISTTFLISPRHISNVSVAAIPSVTYDGDSKTPTVTVTDGGNELTLGTHYTVSYSNNTNAGTANVTITGIGNYTGSRIEHFSIGKISPNLSIDQTTINWALGDLDTKNITATHDGDGVVSAAITSGSGISVSTSGDVITLTRSAGNPPGTVTVTVSVAEGTNHSAESTTCKITLNSTLALLKTWLNANHLNSTHANDYMGYYVDASGNITSTSSGAIGRIVYYTYLSSGLTAVDVDLTDRTILVMAVSDASSSCMWKISNSEEEGYNNSDVRNGYTFTINHNNAIYPAAQAAAAYSVSLPDGASTWFLPSYRQFSSAHRETLVDLIENDTYYWVGNVSFVDNKKASRIKRNGTGLVSDIADFTETHKVRPVFAY
ncbi:MAG: fimbrillin family protein [Prevotella sp.]|nr:fimbrillin family protein [Prevotella sp.]